MNGKPVFTVPARAVLNLDSGFRHKLLCDGLTFSTGTACVYSCAFCYVPEMTRKQRPWLEQWGVPADAPHADLVIRRASAVDLLSAALDRPKVRALAQKPLVIYSSPAVDVAGNLELVRETIECCRAIIRRTKWDIRLLSKSNLLPKVAEGLVAELGEYAVLKRLLFGVSTGCLDDSLARAYEQGTPLVSKRLASLHWLQDHGFRTFGMLCPSLPQADYRAFAQEAAEKIRADRCEHVWAEVINLRGESFTRTLQALRAADFESERARLEQVSGDREAWEHYARDAFHAHATVYAGQRGPDGLPKLRFLQYVTAATRDWWSAQASRGAVLL